jgi:hypothetical protein
MEKESFKFPSVLKEAVSGLDHELRWKILESIIKNGSMSYSKLLSDLNIEKKRKGKLTFHLGKLTTSALIERFEQLGTWSERSFYDISPFGKDLINGLMESIAPQTTPAGIFEGDWARDYSGVTSTSITQNTQGKTTPGILSPSVSNSIR